MKYNGVYFALFRGTMKKVLAAYCGRAFARDTIKKAHKLYKKLMTEAMASFTAKKKIAAV